MALSNAERQARLRERKQQRLSICVTPADIDRAVQMLYDACRYDDPSMPPFSEWLEEVERSAKRKAGDLWRHMLPDSAEAEDYHEHLSLEDRQFLAMVGSVIRASKLPSAHR